MPLDPETLRLGAAPDLGLRGAKGKQAESGVWAPGQPCSDQSLLWIR
jgi:hypothetical protein